MNSPGSPVRKNRALDPAEKSRVPASQELRSEVYSLMRHVFLQQAAHEKSIFGEVQKILELEERVDWNTNLIRERTTRAIEPALPTR